MINGTELAVWPTRLASVLDLFVDLPSKYVKLKVYITINTIKVHCLQSSIIIRSTHGYSLCNLLAVVLVLL